MKGQRPAFASRVFDTLEDWLARGTPHRALPAAAVLGQARNRLSRRWPSPEQVQSLFPHLDRSAAARLAWRIGGLEARNRVLVAGIRRAGLEPVRPLVRCPEAFTALRPPVLLGTFHVGAMHALGPALEQLPGPVLALRQGPLFVPRPPLEVATTEGDEQSRSALFHRALLHLDRGGFVALALDVVQGSALRVSCLGRPLALARGPFALARLTGTPLVPLVARWRSGGVEILLGDPLALPGQEAGPEAWEGALAASAARWLESYLLASPGELGLGLLRNLLGLTGGS
jgi:hypothetical protein